MQATFNWKEAELVDFTVNHEDWQYYKLSDGSRMKIKLVLGNIWRSTNQFDTLGQPNYIWTSQNIFALASFPAMLRGTPSSKPVTPELIAQNMDEAVSFEPFGKQDKWNFYSLNDGSKLRLRPNITSIARTKIKGQGGEPFYSISAGPPNYNMTVARALIRKSTGQTFRETKSHAYG